MTENSEPTATPARKGSTLVLYYIASGLWMLAGMVTMVSKSEDRITWLPYFCVIMGVLFLSLARRKRRSEDRSG